MIEENTELFSDTETDEEYKEEQETTSTDTSYSTADTEIEEDILFEHCRLAIETEDELKDINMEKIDKRKSEKKLL